MTKAKPNLNRAPKTLAVRPPCGCLCRLNHPARMGICYGRAFVTVTLAGRGDVDMCLPCAEARS